MNDNEAKAITVLRALFGQNTPDNLPDAVDHLIDHSNKGWARCEELVSDLAEKKRECAETKRRLAISEAACAMMRKEIEKAITMEWFHAHVTFTSPSRLQEALDARMAKYSSAGASLLQQLEAADKMRIVLKAARDELRMIREKDGAGPYDPTLKSVIDYTLEAYDKSKKGNTRYEEFTTNP